MKEGIVVVIVILLSGYRDCQDIEDKKRCRFKVKSHEYKKKTN